VKALINTKLKQNHACSSADHSGPRYVDPPPVLRHWQRVTVLMSIAHCVSTNIRVENYSLAAALVAATTFWEVRHSVRSLSCLGCSTSYATRWWMFNVDLHSLLKESLDHGVVPPGVKDVSVWLTETAAPSDLLF